MTTRFGLAACLVLSCLLPVAVWGFDAQTTVTVERTMVALVAGPPGTPAQEVATDRTLIEAVGGHRQALGANWTAEGSVRATLDTLPSGNPRLLPERKLDASAAVLEAWIGWEPWPGALSLGAGKRVIQPSSGFSHQPLNGVSRSDKREGQLGVQGAWFSEAWSVSVFKAPKWTLGRLGVTSGALDFKTQVLQTSRGVRPGLGLDAGWGDHLTFRTEVAADARFDHLKSDALAGLTWTNDDLSTLMVEASWDTRDHTPGTGFVRWAGTLDQGLDAEAWVKGEGAPGTKVNDLSGWMGFSMTWSADHWSVGGSWTGAWGPEGAQASGPLRWKTALEVKTFW